MSKKASLKPVVAAVSTAFVLSTGAAVAADNPFGVSELSSGYMQVAAAHEGGKCGAGKCGGDKKDEAGKCGAGKCGGDKKADSGKCGGDKKAEAGKCGGDKKADSGKCGAGKCGGSK